MFHDSVLLQKVIENLNIRDDSTLVDATLGGGGMSLAIIERLRNGTLICIDQDSDAIDNFYSVINRKYNKDIKVGTEFSIGGVRIIVHNGNFRNIADFIGDIKVDGVIYDFGVSSFQIDNASRGFSYMQDTKLDMRMDKRLTVSAIDLLNGLYEKELAKLFIDFSDEPLSKIIAKKIVELRKREKIEKSSQLLGIIRSVVKNHAYLYRHASRIFQALRIAVNDELGAIHFTLPQLPMILDLGGRVEFLTFNSLEDREIKQFFRNRHDFRSIHDKPIRPTDDEIQKNIRSRSAKLRVYEKI